MRLVKVKENTQQYVDADDIRTITKSQFRSIGSTIFFKSGGNTEADLLPDELVKLLLSKKLVKD